MQNSFTKLLTLCCLVVLSGCGTGLARAEDSATRCLQQRDYRHSEVLACYVAAQAEQKLVYLDKGSSQVDGVEKRRYELTSQNWSPAGMVTPAGWKHDVEIYIPADALNKTALLVSNNGINIAAGQNGVRPLSDIPEAMAVAIAKKTRTIVISVNNIPNQYLTFADDGQARREDSAVAHSWNLFMQDTKAHAFLPMHLPMAATLVKAMDLAQQELPAWKIDRFIATGASKRAWAVWLASIADPRITAIVPFVLDILNMDRVMQHTYDSYGQQWPLAFADYQRAGVTSARQSTAFAQLLQIEDPLRYLDSPYAARLAIPKYIVNASGDDFFVPDNTQFFYARLPGEKTLRSAPNSSHYGIRDVVENSLVSFINRRQRGQALPQIAIEAADNKGKDPGQFTVRFSQTPVKITQWSAHNPLARDFRFACGIRYTPNSLELTNSVTVMQATPTAGWSASFVEAEFADGMVVTTPVQILPQHYPEQPAAGTGPACQTIGKKSPAK